jgi:hypothetical protein
MVKKTFAPSHISNDILLVKAVQLGTVCSFKKKKNPT